MHTHGPQTALIETLALKNKNKDYTRKMPPKTPKCQKVDDAPIYEYRLVPGLRSTSNLLCVDEIQQIFKYKYTRNNVKYYYCYQKNCRAGVLVELNNSQYCRLTSKNDIHNHETQSELIKRLELINKFKKKAHKSANRKKAFCNSFENSNLTQPVEVESSIRPLLKLRKNFEALENDCNFIKEEPVSDTEPCNMFEDVLDTTEESSNPTAHVLSTDFYSLMEEQEETVDFELNRNSLDSFQNISMIQDQWFEFKIIPGFRATSNLLYIEAIQQIFKFKYTRNDNKYYYCYQKNCHAGAIVRKNAKYCRLTAKHNVHNHSPQTELIKALERKYEIRETRKMSQFQYFELPPEETAYTVENGNSTQLFPMIQSSSEPINNDPLQEALDRNVSGEGITIKEEPIFENETSNNFVDENSNTQLFSITTEPNYTCDDIKNEIDDSMNVLRSSLGNTSSIDVSTENQVHNEIANLNKNVEKISPSKLAKLRSGNIFEYTIVPGLRTTSNLLCIDALQQIFKYKYTRNNVKYYYCYQKKCHAGVVVELNNDKFCRLTAKKYTHTHGSQSELIKTLSFINKQRKDGQKTRKSYNKDATKKLEDISHTIVNGYSSKLEWNSEESSSEAMPNLAAIKKTEELEKPGKTNYIEESCKKDVNCVEENKIFAYKFIAGFRISSKLLYIEETQQIFMYKYMRNNTKYYTCYVKKCSAGVVLESENATFCRLAGKNHIHKHGPQIETIEKLKSINCMKESKTKPQRTSLESRHEGNLYEYEIIQGFRVRSTLLYIEAIQQIFKLRHIKNDTKYYYCYEKHCNIGAVVEANNPKFCEIYGNVHKHGPQTKLLQKLKLNTMQKIMDNDAIQTNIDGNSTELEKVTLSTPNEEEEVFEYILIQGLRKTSTLLYIPALQQVFRVQYTKKNLTYYYCYEKQCSVGVVVKTNDTKYCRLSSKKSVHNHGPQTSFLHKLNAKYAHKNATKKPSLTMLKTEDKHTDVSKDNNCQTDQVKSPKGLQCILWCDIEHKLLTHPRQHFKSCPSCYEKMKKIDKDTPSIVNNS